MVTNLGTFLSNSKYHFENVGKLSFFNYSKKSNNLGLGILPLAAQLVGRQSAVREDKGWSPRPDQLSGS